jgi:hypothetical protein
LDERQFGLIAQELKNLPAVVARDSDTLSVDYGA